MEAKTRCLLIYLFSVSRFGGECRPGYKAMREALRGPLGKGSDDTVRRALNELNTAGWIFNMRRTNGLMAIYLQIPLRFRREEKRRQTVLKLFKK